MSRATVLLLLLGLATPLRPGLAEEVPPPRPPAQVRAQASEPAPLSLTERILEEQRARHASPPAEMSGLEAAKAFERYEKMLSPEPKAAE